MPRPASATPLSDAPAPEAEARAPSLKDVIRLAEKTAETLRAFHARLDREIQGELLAIANYIMSMRREIAALGVNDLQSTHLPMAGHELDEIVRATEAATNTIMGCAEELLAADALASGAAAYQALVQDVATRIFEACAFQDLTGQRIAKVVETLQAIETRVGRFAAAVCVPEDGAPANAREAAREERRRSLLLHGPQDKGVAIEQGDIDAILATSEEADQDAVDALFK